VFFERNCGAISLEKHANSQRAVKMTFMKILPKLILILLLVAAGCSPKTVSPVSVTQPASVQPSAVPTATPQPSPTAQPGKVILLAPSGADAQSFQTVLAELGGVSGLFLETQADLQPAGLGQNVRVVVALAPPANLNDLLSASPQTQFVVISGADLPQANNLSVIRWRPESQAFLGGFISVLLSTDWRSGGLLPSDGPLAANLQDAFVNGGRYFCGVCAPGWPLGLTYPQVAPLPASSDGPAWQAAAAGLFDNSKVEAYYLAAEAYRPEVVDYLQGKDQFGKTLLLVGVQPPPDSLRAQWAATVSFDTIAPLRQVWPDLLSGKGGAVIEAPLALSDVNTANLGEGRLRLVNDLIEELRTGSIFPFTIPPN
jgi:hypothetical protein